MSVCDPYEIQYHFFFIQLKFYSRDLKVSTIICNNEIQIELRFEISLNIFKGVMCILNDLK